MEHSISLHRAIVKRICYYEDVASVDKSYTPIEQYAVVREFPDNYLNQIDSAHRLVFNQSTTVDSAYSDEYVVCINIVEFPC